MKFVTAVGLLAVMAVPLMGAKCAGEITASLECTTSPIPGCKKSAKLSASWERKQVGIEGLDLENGTFDAALWTISLSGSNVVIPTYGTVLLKLVDSSNDSVIASRNFGWYRSGSTVRLSSPDAVNAWAIDSAGNADRLDYETAAFATSENVGTNNLVMTDRYGTDQVAYTSYNWRSEERCPKRLDHHGNQIIYCP